MNDIFDKLMVNIFKAHGFDLVKMIYEFESINDSSNLYIAKNKVGDYFVYWHAPVHALDEINNEIQIDIASSIENSSSDFQKLNGEGLHVESSFDKKATLIIFSQFQKENENMVKNQAIVIEEDPYFFKKQVMLISQEDVGVISESFNNNKSNYVDFIQDLISDTHRFKAFSERQNHTLSDEVVEYAFVAKLYEKLPFLDLKVTESSQVTLQNSIDEKLTDQQLFECEKLLKLDEENLDDWFEEIIKEGTDD